MTRLVALTVLPLSLMMGLGWFQLSALAANTASDLDSREEVVERAAIRARGRLHGEVRLLRRGSMVVLQTLLVTRTLGRVVARIRDKEEEIWPQGSAGHEASRRYREALTGAVAQVLERERSDRYRRLLIELRLAAGAGVVAFAVPTTHNEDGWQRVLSSEGIRELAIPCDWVRREIELVAADRGLALSAVSPLPSC